MPHIVFLFCCFTLLYTGWCIVASTLCLAAAWTPLSPRALFYEADLFLAAVALGAFSLSILSAALLFRTVRWGMLGLVAVTAFATPASIGPAIDLDPYTILTLALVHGILFLGVIYYWRLLPREGLWSLNA